MVIEGNSVASLVCVMLGGIERVIQVGKTGDLKLHSMFIYLEMDIVLCKI